jgi:hypothetical protein
VKVALEGALNYFVITAVSEDTAAIRFGGWAFRRTYRTVFLGGEELPVWERGWIYHRKYAVAKFPRFSATGGAK